MFVIIVGGGKVGAHLGSLLISEGHTIKVIDIRPAICEQLCEELPRDMIVNGDGSDPNLLEAVGIRSANVLAAVTGEDEANLVVTSLARFEFRVPRVIARVNNPKNAWMFTEDLGVDVALNQAELIAHLVAEEMSLGDMFTLLKLRKGMYSLVEEKVHPDAPAAGRPIRDLALPEKCVLVAVIRKGELIVPRGDTVLAPADEILALVHADDLTTLAHALGDITPGVH